MRKKLFAILMSAMMMVTFMPAMAFATAGTVTVPAKAGVVTVTTPNDYYKATVTTTNGYQEVAVPIARSWNGDGKIKANVLDAATQASSDAKAFETKYPDYAELQRAISANAATDFYYYDLAGATLVRDGNGYDMYDTLTRDQIRNLFTETAGVYTMNTWAIKLAVPSYVSNAAASTAKSVSGNEFTSATLNLVGYDPEATVDQNCTLVANFPSSLANVVNNSGFSAAVVVKAPAATNGSSDAALFFVDKTAATGGIASANAKAEDTPYVISANAYDGAVHKLVMKAGTGVSAKYYKYNAKTAGWDAVEEISWKDVTTGTKFKAVVTDNVTTTTDSSFFFNVIVNKAEIEFALDGNAKTLYFGDECDPYDFVKFTASASATAKSGANASADATKAIAADKEALLNFVKTYYDAKATDKGNEFALTLKAKTLTAAEKKAYDAEVAKANWNVVCTDNGTPTAVTVHRNTKVNDITVTGLDKTIHVKKAKATKKAYTKTVKAETLAGTAKFKKVSGNSKITVASDGKITIKKGLKKGTYKVKVKAYVPEGLGYLYASTTEVVKVKVVK